jgi:hypothetical protein
MDRGEASSQHRLRITEKEFLTKHNLLIQSPKKNNIGQCQAVRLRPIQRLLLSDGYRSSLRLNIPPSVQWPTRASKLTHIYINQEMSGRQKERKVSRRVAKGSLESQHLHF